MRDLVSDFNSMESNSESDSVERNSDSNSNSNYGNSNSIPIQILAIPIQFQFRSDWEKPIQFQFQFRNWNWNWQAIPIPDRNWPQLCSCHLHGINKRCRTKCGQISDGANIRDVNVLCVRAAGGRAGGQKLIF